MPDFSPDFKEKDDNDKASTPESKQESSEKNPERIKNREKIEKQITDWIDSFFDSSKTLDSPFADSELLKSFLSEEQRPKGRKINEPLRFAARTFIEKIIHKTKQQSREAHAEGDENKIKQVKDFVSRIYDSFFSFTPTIANLLHKEDLILMTAKANQVPELQGWMGQSMVGESVYEASFGGGEIANRLVEKLEDSSVTEVLDVIDQLKTIAALAIGNGHWSQSGYEKIVDTIKALDDAYEQPIVHIKTEQTRKELKKEWKNPSLGPVTFRGNTHSGRMHGLSEEQISNDQSLRKKYQESNKHPGHYMQQYASDTVFLIDKSGTPRFATRIPQNQSRNMLESESSETISPRDLESLRSKLEKLVERPDGTARWLAQVDELMSVVDEGQEIEEIKEIRRLLQDQIDKARKAQERLQARKKKEKERRQRAEHKYRELIRAFIEKFNKHIPKILSGLCEKSKEDIKPLVNSIQSEDTNIDKKANALDRLFQKLSLRGAEIKDDMPGVSMPNHFNNKEAQQAAKDLMRAYDKTVEKVERHQKKLAKDLREDKLSRNEDSPMNEEYARLLTDLRKFAQNKFPRIKSDIFSQIEKLEEKIRKNTNELTFQPLEKVTRSLNLEGEDKSLLLKRLYEPAIKNKLEEDFDVNLKNLSLRSQISLLDFIVNQDKERYEDLSSLAQNYRGSQAKFLNAFLATEIDSSVSSAIINIARHEDPQVCDAVFTKFDELTSQTDRISDFLQEEFSADQKEELIDKITKQLLQKGRNVLVDYADKIQHENTDAQAVIRELESIRTEDKLFLSTLKTLTETDELPELAEISNMNLSRINSEELQSEQIEQMKNIYEKNYPTENYSEQIQESLLEKLDTLIANNSEFYLLDYKGEIKGFVTFLSEDNEVSNISVKQAASLNVDPDFQNHRIGQLMIDKALEQEAQSNVLVANSKAHSSLSSRYIEKGFVGVEIFRESGTELLDIVWDKNTNQSYRFKPMVEEEIIQLFTENQVQGAAEFSTGEKIKKVNSLADLNFIDLDEDKVLTRLFEHEDGWLAVFEPAPDREYPESIK